RNGLVTFQTADLDSQDGVKKAVEDADVVVGSVPGFMGYRTMERVIKNGKNFVDIAFMAEDARKLDKIAKKEGVTVVYDCGVAPGISNMVVGHFAASFDSLSSARIYVGGLPEERSWPYQYKAPFSPSDVLEEYVRPARYVKNGKMVEMPALSEPELMSFENVGELEAFNTDGLRSLIDTIACPNMVEKTLRYPGHIELMRVLRESGFFSLESVDVNGVAVRPRDLTSTLLFPMWELGPNEREFTVMRIVVEGMMNEKMVRYTCNLLDRYDEKSGFSSMSRTTGFPCTIIAREVASGRFEKPGVHPPELLGKIDNIFDTVVTGLTKRRVILDFETTQP
ncbi:MAG TPA: saccharopine dehydrogenase, partial [Euryarchaeota archaeon]|nr:saccharopine dehydrogenase [Euryarchaeota archaeon]